MMLAKYLTKFEKVFYNSVEEGLSRSVQIAYERVGMIEASGKITLKKEGLEAMIERLQKRKSANIVFVDSLQFLGITFKDYKRLKTMFPASYSYSLVTRQTDSRTGKQLLPCGGMQV
jgi:lipoate-protein ligase A